MTAFTHDAYFSKSLAEADPDIYGGIQGELGRQQEQIELIASENIVSQAVLEAQGSVLTNKYAEGYPGRRYYGGCEYVDVTENLPASAPSNCSAPPSPTSSRTRGPRPIRRCSRPC